MLLLKKSKYQIMGLNLILIYAFCCVKYVMLTVVLDTNNIVDSSNNLMYFFTPNF